MLSISISKKVPLKTEWASKSAPQEGRADRGIRRVMLGGDTGYWVVQRV